MSETTVKVPGPDRPITVALRESTYRPVHSIPRRDVDMDALRRSDTTSHCPYKGRASYFSLPAGGPRSMCGLDLRDASRRGRRHQGPSGLHP